jgi:glycosyltransferase involved in cell wall biosynthesis
MKVLLSTYTCGPGRGSEPGVGWHWAIEIARLGHEVWVLTRAINKGPIEDALSRMSPMSELHFVYYDLPPWLRAWQKGQRGIRTHYVLWQWGAYRLARRLHQAVGFDLVHHITFVSIRFPSFMGGLGVPFCFGPAGGGEDAPWRLLVGCSVRAWIIEGLRWASNSFVRLDPFMRATFRKAARIYVTSNEAFDRLPMMCRQKTQVHLAIGFDPAEMRAPKPKPSAPKEDSGHLRMLFAGRLLYLKGLHLGMRALARARLTHPAISLTIVGDGSDRRRIHALAGRLGLADAVTFVPWIPREDLAGYYSSHDVFLFPSLHDSGGMAVLEALAHGLPVVCLDLGGPGQIVTPDCGLAIDASGRTSRAVVADLADAMLRLASDPEYATSLSAGARARAALFSWPTVVARVYPQADRAPAVQRALDPREPARSRGAASAQ